MDTKPRLISTIVFLKVYAFNNYETLLVPLLHQNRNPEDFKEEPHLFAVQWYDQVLSYMDHAGIELTLRSDPVNVSPVYFLDPIDINDDLLGTQYRNFSEFLFWKGRGLPMKWKIAGNLYLYRDLHFGHEHSLFHQKIKMLP